MKNFTRRVVILENLTSPYVHQAIIVLNDYNPAHETKVICDAEKIVSDYLKKNDYPVHDNTKIYKGRNNKYKNEKGMTFLITASIAVLVFGAYIILKSVI